MNSKPTPKTESTTEQEPNNSLKLEDIQDFVNPEPLAKQPLPEPSLVHPKDTLASHSEPKLESKPQQQNNYQVTPSYADTSDSKLTPQQEKDLVRYNHISYVLYLLSFFTAGVTWIIPIFMNYYKRGEAEGTWLATHFDWQIKTFWYSLMMGVVAIFLVFFGVSGLGVSVLSESGGLAIGSSLLFVLAGFIFLLSLFWHLYRIVRGWIALSDGRPI